MERRKLTFEPKCMACAATWSSFFGRVLRGTYLVKSRWQVKLILTGQPEISLCNLCVLCVSVVDSAETTETQRTRRLHREGPALFNAHW